MHARPALPVLVQVSVGALLSILPYNASAMAEVPEEHHFPEQWSQSLMLRHDLPWSRAHATTGSEVLSEAGKMALMS